MSIYSLFMLIGGLAFFLFGMNIMSSNLEKLAGGKLQEILKRLTANPLKSMLFGVVITIAIQSSSALTVMLVGLVNSGIMEFTQTVHILMGSNIGTTLTSWILSLSGIQSDNFLISMLKPENFSPIVALIGIIMLMSGKKQHTRDVGTILCGFAILMYGMTLMSDAVEPLADMPQFGKMLVAFKNPVISLLIGVAFTGVIQSSAASIGVLQALAMTGYISYGIAIPIVIGANIGTCVTAILSSIGTSKEAKRVPCVHVLVNVFGMIVWMSAYFVARYIARMPLFDESIDAFGIAVFHSIFNIGTVFLLLPFTKQLVRIVEKILPVEKAKEVEQPQVLLDERLLVSPGLAVSQSFELTREMAKLAEDAVRTAWPLFDEYDEDTVQKVIAMETRQDQLTDALNTYLIKLSQRDLTDDDNTSVSEMLHTINDFERIGDHAVNLTEIAKELVNSGQKFSSMAKQEVTILGQAICEILHRTVDSFDATDIEGAGRIEPLEETVDSIIKEMRNRHIDRLQSGECKPGLGVVLTDLLINSERISDHCSNVALAVIETVEPDFEMHGYLDDLKSEEDSEFIEEVKSCREKYRLPDYVPTKKKHKGKEKDKKKNKDKDKDKDKKSLKSSGREDRSDADVRKDAIPEADSKSETETVREFREELRAAEEEEANRKSSGDLHSRKKKK